MQIINKNNNCIIAENAFIADSPLKRVKGLLGRTELPKGEALIIRPCNSIHTIFMRFPIDVLFVDAHNTIVKIKSFLKPFRLTGIYFNTAYVVELPAGTIEESHAAEGHTLILK
jgi:uncharacterized protein